MAYTCFKCKVNEVPDEFQRCPPCEVSHKELCAKLDARPKVIEKKVKEELFPIKIMRGGIQCTDWIDRNDAIVMGIQLPTKKE